LKKFTLLDVEPEEWRKTIKRPIKPQKEVRQQANENSPSPLKKARPFI